MTSYSDLLQIAAPEAIVVVAALALLAVDLAALREVALPIRRVILGLVAAAGCLAAIGWMTALPLPANLTGGMLAVNPLTQLVKIGLLILTLGTLLLSVESEFTRHVGEYFALVLLAAVGMMLLVSAQDILLVFLALELTSLSLYVLVAFNKQDIRSAEAALKYFLFGGMSAAFTLFGLSLLYGLSGATDLRLIAAALHGPKPDPLLWLALVMVVVGFGFKVAAVPFHLWAPDAYEGAPLPSAALIASGSKVAGFFIFAKVMAEGFAGAEGSGAWHGFIPGWVPLLAVVAAASMVLGNLAAIVQRSVRRLLAYSAIAHAGYMLLAVMSRGEPSLAPLVYYVLTYALTTLGAFGVVAVVRDQTGRDGLADFAGLSRRAPLAAWCMMVFLLSLAGIPPLAGFFGKFYVFAALLRSGNPPLGLLWLVILAVALSAVSLYYYLAVLKQIFVAQPAPDLPPCRPAPIRQACLTLLAVAVVWLGIMPAWLLERVEGALRVAGL